MEYAGLSKLMKIKKEDKRYYLLLYKIAKNQDQFNGSKKKNYSLSNFSSETVNFFLPLALLAANTLRPLASAIRARKPCLLFLLRFDGW